MNKKLVCFLLAFIMAVPMLFTGCSSSNAKSGGETTTETTAPTTSDNAMTITLYGITGESTTEEAIAKVQDEFNKYTEGKFNTHVILKLYTEDEYYDILDKKTADKNSGSNSAIFIVSIATYFI
jgi:ABC-type glycerol-3-phosphate transport system substrate-binding protein